MKNFDYLISISSSILIISKLLLDIAYMYYEH